MNKTLLTAKEAAELIKARGINLSRATLYNWARKFAIGYQIGGPGHMNPWRFYEDKLIKHIEGMENTCPVKEAD